jgi:hypothetical protein
MKSGPFLAFKTTQYVHLSPGIFQETGKNAFAQNDRKRILILNGILLY